jgi:hypothetical protein
MSAGDSLSPDQFDYRMAHRPPDPDHDSGAPFHEADSVMPDVTGPRGQHLYDHHAVAPGRRIPFEKSISAESFKQLRDAKGNPDHEVKVYRATPKPEAGIQPGDWVTPSRRYAQEHAKHESDPSKDMPVVEGRAKASELWGHGDDPNEWGYHPS